MSDKWPKEAKVPKSRRTPHRCAQKLKVGRHDKCARDGFCECSCGATKPFNDTANYNRPHKVDGE